MLSESDLHYVLTIEPNDLDFSKVPSCVSIVLNILLYKGINFEAIANETESVMKGILAFLHLIGEQNSSLRTWLQHFLPIQLDIFREQIENISVPLFGCLKKIAIGLCAQSSLPIRYKRQPKTLPPVFYGMIITCKQLNQINFQRIHKHIFDLIINRTQTEFMIKINQLWEFLGSIHEDTKEREIA